MKTHTKRYLALVAFLVTATGVLRAQPRTQEDLLEFLTLQLEQARAKIKTVSYTLEEQEHADSVLIRTATAEVKESGASRWSSVVRSDDLASGKPLNTIARTVRNGRYFAIWPEVQRNMAYQYDHLSLGERSEDSKVKDKLYSAPDPFSYCFGNSTFTLRESRAQPASVCQWGAETQRTASGEEVYFVYQYRPAMMEDPAHPFQIYTIDPSRGFLITNFKVFAPNGQLAGERIATVDKIEGTDVWFPTLCEERRYASGSSPSATGDGSGRDEERLSRQVVLRVTHIQVNQPMDPAQFEIGALGLDPKRTEVLHKTIDGRIEELVPRGGRLVPLELLNSLELQLNRSVQSLNPATQPFAHTQPAPTQPVAPATPEAEQLPVRVSGHAWARRLTAMVLIAGVLTVLLWKISHKVVK